MEHNCSNHYGDEMICAVCHKDLKAENAKLRADLQGAMATVEAERKALLRVAQEFGCSGHDRYDWYKEVQRVLGLIEKPREGS